MSTRYAFSEDKSKVSFEVVSARLNSAETIAANSGKYVDFRFDEPIEPDRIIGIREYNLLSYGGRLHICAIRFRMDAHTGMVVGYLVYLKNTSNVDESIDTEGTGIDVTIFSK